MSRPARLLRLVVLASCSAVAASSLALPTAQAAPIDLVPSHTRVQQRVYFADGVSSSTACTIDGSSTAGRTLDFTNGSGSDTLAVDVTVTNLDPVAPDPTDVTHVTGQVSVSGSQQGKSGSTSSYRMSGTGSVTVVPDLGDASLCAVEVGLLGGVTLTVTESKPGWMYLSRAQQQGVTTKLSIVAEDGSEEYLEIVGGPASSATARTFLAAGSYQEKAWFTVWGSARLGSVQRAPAPSATMSGVFHAAGSALSRARGTGTAYLALPSATSCSKHTASLGWTGKAGKVRSASVSVNGSLAAKAGTPTAGSSLVLKKLSATRDLKITANLLMKDSSKRSVTRSYVPCQG